MRVKVQEGENFPEFSIFHFILNFSQGKKRKIFQEIIRKIFHSVFTHQGKQCVFPSSVLFVSKMT